MTTLELHLDVVGSPTLRRPLDKRVLTLGSDARADLRSPALPKQWAMVKRRDDERIEVRFLESGDVVVLTLGERVARDGAALALRSPQAVDDTTDDTTPRLPV
ncbi:MAG: hypothetical protein KC586_29230, partial [Myxococcales bacterium]|nr:hypothetical protein [Myxococcales bacterium]